MGTENFWAPRMNKYQHNPYMKANSNPNSFYSWGNNNQNGAVNKSRTNYYGPQSASNNGYDNTPWFQPQGNDGGMNNMPNTSNRMYTQDYTMRGGMNGGYMNEQNQNMSGSNWQGNPASNDSGIPQQEMSGWEQFSLGAKGAGSLAQAWLAWQGLEETKRQNAFARDAANTDVNTQANLIADEIRSQERARASRYGTGFNSTGDTSAQRRVRDMNLPSNATGGKLDINWS